MSPPTRAGRTCRSRAPSSTCSSASSRSPARPQRRTSADRPQTTHARRCRRPRARRLRRVRPPPLDGAAGAGRLTPARATADHPPGFYGPPEGLLAVNTLPPPTGSTPLDFRAAQRAAAKPIACSEPQDLRGPIFLAALALLADRRAGRVLARRAALRGCVPRRRAHRAAARCRVAASLPARRSALARSAPRRRRARPQADDFALKATLETQLAYVLTGDAEVDAISKAGLRGLTLFLAQRTALEAGEPIGLDHRARRTRLLSADLLADRARRAEALAAKRSRASTPT